MILVHGTCVALDGAGVLLRGPSGSGKSDLALRLIDGGAILVADDQVEVESRDGVLFAGAPETIAGRLEIRGVGIVCIPHAPAALKLLVDLVAAEKVPRLPEPSTEAIDGIGLPVVALAAFDASAPAKLRHALALFAR